MKRAGFSLIELLVVIAIMGILITVGMVNLARWRADSAVMEGAQQFAQAINQTRTSAKRDNACRQISLVSTISSNTGYQVKEYGGPICTGTPTQTRVFAMPPGTVLTLDTTSTAYTVSNVGFSPPFGTTDSSPNQFLVSWAANPTIFRTVRATGVFGKVIVK